MKKILWDLLTEMENGTGKADTYYEILRLMKAIDTETTKPVNVDLADVINCTTCQLAKEGDCEGCGRDYSKWKLRE